MFFRSEVLLYPNSGGRGNFADGLFIDRGCIQTVLLFSMVSTTTTIQTVHLLLLLRPFIDLSCFFSAKFVDGSVS